MLINKDKKYYYANVNDYETVKFNGAFYTAETAFIIDDDSDIAQKIQEYVPNFDFIIEDGELVDVVKTEHIATVEELRNKYEELVVEKIRLRYTATDETKILREALAAQVLTEFEVYNSYVEECKVVAHSDVYGEGK